MALFELHKKFGTETAVDRLDLVVTRGSFFGLAGPNGAGKRRRCPWPSGRSGWTPVVRRS